MKRRIFKLVLFLLLGAFINIAVAWGCALAIDVSAAERLGINEGNRFSPYFMALGQKHGRIGAVRIALARKVERTGDFFGLPGVDDAIPTWAAFVLPPALDQHLANWNDTPVRVADARGWPELCMWGGFSFPDDDNRRSSAACQSTFSILLTDPTAATVIKVRLIPLMPLWPGFAINTIFYAAIVWLLFAFPFVVRRRGRIKRGLCPACAYPVGDSAVCTECGKALKA